MHNMRDCCCFDKGGKPLGASVGDHPILIRPTKSTGARCKRPSAYAKAKKASKSKTHKKHGYDFTSNSSNSEKGELGAAKQNMSR